MRSPSPTDNRKAGPLPGGLYVVATPIGNLKDITLRALETLASVDLIAAEDTRHSARLLAHHQIDTPLISFHEHNERQRIPGLIEKIRSGRAVALVSDAGTPSVSDPGYRLIRCAVDEGLKIHPIPGVSAAVTALSVSGLPMQTFLFLGFAPKATGKRLDLLASLADEPRTMVFYESPQRLLRFLKELHDALGDRPIVLAREMTKLHEEFVRGRLLAVLERLNRRPVIKGECTLLIGGRAQGSAVTETELADAIRAQLAVPGTRVSSLSKTLAKQYRVPRKTVYRLALRLTRRPLKGPDR